MTTMNPFLVQSPLPYLAPHFDQIANHHYRPAFDEGMQQKRAEIAAIALNPQTPDFNNTILALEQSGELLTRVTSVFFAMTRRIPMMNYSVLMNSFPLNWRNWLMISI